MKKQRGFTLFEIIITLILVGIVSAVAGLGIVSFVEGYLFVKDNSIVAGKAQVALARITRELTDLHSIPSPTSNAATTSITFDKVSGATSIGLGGNGNSEILIATGTAGSNPSFSSGDILVDQVSGLSFDYKKSSNNWNPAADDIRDLSHIVINLSMSNAGGGSNFTFSTVVNPRNNGNAGGAPIPTPDNPPAFTQSCFIATSAYGNSSHPMVVILRQFRDRYLNTWSIGRRFTNLYYTYSPRISGIIETNSCLKIIVRILLLPIVSISFLIIYAKGAIPLVLMITAFSFWAFIRFKKANRRSGTKTAQRISLKNSIFFSDHGSVLIGIIFSILIISVLGVVIFSMVDTSSMRQTVDKVSKNSYYLAESGFRYAASQFLHSTDSSNNGRNDDQNAMANTLDGRTLNMTEGAIQLEVIPFYLVSSSDQAVGATTLNVRFPGAAPNGFSVPSTGKLQIRTQTRPNASTAYTTITKQYQYTSFSSNMFTLLSSNPITTEIPEWTSVTVIANPSSQQNITPGSAATLMLSNPVASSGFFMPPKNGKFQIQGNSVIYRYDYCETDSNSNTSTLHGIYDSDDPQSTDTFSVSTTTDIIPNDFFTIKSIGTYAGVSRTVTFITPVDFMDSSDSDTQKTTYSDTFDTNPGTSNSASNWHDSVFGSHAIATVSGGTKSGDTTANNALKVTGTYSYNSGTSFFSDDIFLSLIPFKWSQNYANFLASWQANEKTLSYDAQVKLKLPQQDYYMGGINFRMKLSSSSISGLSSLSLSLQRGRNGSSCFLFFCTDDDGIDNSLVPVDDTATIVLWKKTEGQSHGLDWIAYKIIDDSITFNNGQYPYFQNGSNSYFIRGESSGARADITAVNTNDNGISGSLSLSSQYSTFQTNEKLFQLILQNNVTAQVDTPISSSSIDYDRGENEINVGDIIQGQSSGARALVANITRTQYSQGWRRYYRGTITISELEGTFSNNEWLDVYRSHSNYSARFAALESLSDILTSGTQYIKDWTTLLLRIEEKIDGTDGNVNDIRVYIGDTSQHGSPDGSPLDSQRYANKRWSSPPMTDDINWPPEDGWSDDQGAYQTADHFTLIQNWKINPSFSSTVWLTGTSEEPNSIVRTTEYTTHNLSDFTQNEIGLHTFGDGMTNSVYFDDFAIQMVGATTGGTQGFSYPLQY